MFGGIFSNRWMAKLASLIPAALGVPTFDDGSGNQVIYKEVIIDLSTDPNSGEFTSGDLKVTRFGNQVTVCDYTGIPSFATDSSINSLAGLVPSWAVPPTRPMINNSHSDTNFHYKSTVSPDGSINIETRAWSGALSTRTNSPFNVSYNI